MRDPGCHWFYVGGGPNHRQYVKAVVRNGLLNLDEAALIMTGPGGTKIEPRRREADPLGQGRLRDHDGQAGT